MSDDWDDWLSNFRSQIEQRLREQLERHQKINPYSDRRQIIDIQINQERERLELNADKADDEGKHVIAEIIRELSDDYLPELARDLKRR